MDFAPIYHAHRGAFAAFFRLYQQQDGAGKKRFDEIFSATFGPTFAAAWRQWRERPSD